MKVSLSHKKLLKIASVLKNKATFGFAYTTSFCGQCIKARAFSVPTEGGYFIYTATVDKNNKAITARYYASNVDLRKDDVAFTPCSSVATHFGIAPF
jgi:hypothetical protein